MDYFAVLFYDGIKHELKTVKKSDLPIDDCIYKPIEKDKFQIVSKDNEVKHEALFLRVGLTAGHLEENLRIAPINISQVIKDRFPEYPSPDPRSVQHKRKNSVETADQDIRKPKPRTNEIQKNYQKKTDAPRTKESSLSRPKLRSTYKLEMLGKRKLDEANETICPTKISKVSDKDTKSPVLSDRNEVEKAKKKEENVLKESNDCYDPMTYRKYKVYKRLFRNPECEKEKNLPGQEAEKTKNLLGQEAQKDKDLPGQEAEKDKELPGQEAEKDKELPGQEAEKDKELPGQEAGKDKNPLGKETEKDKNLPGQEVEKDKKLPGQEAEMDENLVEAEAENDKQLSGQKAEEEKEPQGQEAENDKILPEQEAEKNKKHSKRKAKKEKKLLEQKARREKKHSRRRAEKDKKLPRTEKKGDEKLPEQEPEKDKELPGREQEKGNISVNLELSNNRPNVISSKLDNNVADKGGNCHSKPSIVPSSKVVDDSTLDNEIKDTNEKNTGTNEDNIAAPEIDQNQRVGVEADDETFQKEEKPASKPREGVSSDPLELHIISDDDMSDDATVDAAATLDYYKYKKLSAMYNTRTRQCRILQCKYRLMRQEIKKVLKGCYKALMATRMPLPSQYNRGRPTQSSSWSELRNPFAPMDLDGLMYDDDDALLNIFGGNLL